MKAVLALVLPWFLVAGLLHLYLPARGSGRSAIVCGLGGFGALLLTAAYMYLWGIAGLPYQRAVMAAPLALGAVAVGLLMARRGLSFPLSTDGASPGLALAVACLCLLILGHLALAGIEVWFRPLFPFDSTSAWATKARVWSDAGHWVPFVDKASWLADTTGEVFTDHRPGYPIVTPLLQAGMAIANGGWDSRLINVPWLLAYLSLLLIFYGFGRQLGIPLLTAILLTYFLASMPLLHTHVALAGYADLFMACGVLTSLCLLALWCRQKQPWQALLLIVFLIACPLIKNEGLFWAVAIVAGGVVSFFPGWRGFLILGALALLGAVALMLIPEDLEIAGHSLQQLGLRFHPDAVRPFFQNFFMANSWHLAFYLVPATLVFWLVRGMPGKDVIVPASAALGVALLLLGVLFLCTGYYQGAIRFTAVSRITMALAPGLLFLAMLLAALRPGVAPPAGGASKTTANILPSGK